MIGYFGDGTDEDEGLIAAVKLALKSGRESGVVVFSNKADTSPQLIQAPPSKQLH
jgi:hypothetical protein